MLFYSFRVPKGCSACISVRKILLSSKIHAWVFSVLFLTEHSPSHGKLPESKGRLSSLLHKPEFPDPDMMEVLI